MFWFEYFSTLLYDLEYSYTILNRKSIIKYVYDTI